MTIAVVVVVLAGLVLLGVASIRVLREYQRAVVFRLGRVRQLGGPGLIALVPIVDRMIRVDLRTVTLTIPPQEVITRDNVPARVNAVAYFRVTDPLRAILEVEAYPVATSLIAQTTLRSVLGRAELDTLLAEREHLNDSLRQIIDEQTEPWGVKVTTVEIKDVEIPEAMQRAMARQAEAERERRAKVINAEGEFQAAGKLREASRILSESPAALHLRYLQTMAELGPGAQSTIVFPLPIDLLRPFLGEVAQAAAGTRRRRRRVPGVKPEARWKGDHRGGTLDPSPDIRAAEDWAGETSSAESRHGPAADVSTPPSPTDRG